MNQEKIGKAIKELRLKANLSQQQFANKLGVTSQAVSKWETGKNIPDIAIIKKISEEFKVNIEDILNGEIKEEQKEKTKPNKRNIIILIIIILVIGLLIFLIINKSANYNFKVLSSNCDKFNITGTMAYNNKKSSIYISNINYCGGDDLTVYKKIECTLYESNKNIVSKIGDVKVGHNVRLEDFLKKLNFNLDNYDRVCRKYDDRSLYFIINATNSKDQIITYKIPLKLSETCNMK